MNLYQIIKAPVVSEKSMGLKGGLKGGIKGGIKGGLKAGPDGGLEPLNRYVFIVDRRADKLQIRQAVEKMFKVKVTQVNTVIKRGKKKRIGRSIGRKPNVKKAFVTLQQGETIKLFEGV